MSKLSIFGCVVTAVIGLAAMCLCSLIFPPAWSGFAGFLVFICFGAVITATVVNKTGSRRTKVTALCIFIGLIGIAVMQLCNLLIVPPFSGFAGFLVFLIFAAIIAAIIVNQKKYFDSEYQDFLKDHCMHDAAIRLVQTLRGKGVSDTEISRVVKEKFHYSDAEVTAMLNSAR